MVQRVAAKLKPDLVFVAAAMKAVLFFFEIVDIDAKLFADHGAFFPLHPDMLRRLSMRHKFADFITHKTTSKDIIAQQAQRRA